MALFCPGLLTSLRSTWIFFVISGSLFPLAAANTSMGLLLFAAGRIVGGFGAGAATVLVPLYLGRIAPLKLRGAIGNLHQVRNEHLDIHDIQCSNVSRDSRSFIQRMEGQKKHEKAWISDGLWKAFFLTRILKGRGSSCVFVQVAIVLGLLVAQCAGMASGNWTVGSWRIGGTPDNIVLLVWNYRVTYFFVCNLASLPSNVGKLLMNSMLNQLPVHMLVHAHCNRCLTFMAKGPSIGSSFWSTAVFWHESGG